MTTADNRALWELVEKKRAEQMEWCVAGNIVKAAMCKSFADELAAILERPVVVGDYEMFAQYFEQNYNGTVVFAKPRWHAERLWRIAKRAMSLNPETNESMVRGKS